jgi:hypothetical protein
MPHVSSSGGDDLGSTDEVKVFKDEGDGEDEKRSSENLTEEKSSLIDLTESEVKRTRADGRCAHTAIPSTPQNDQNKTIGAGSWQQHREDDDASSVVDYGTAFDLRHQIFKSRRTFFRQKFCATVASLFRLSMIKRNSTAQISRLLLERKSSCCGMYE